MKITKMNPITKTDEKVVVIDTEKDVQEFVNNMNPVEAENEESKPVSNLDNVIDIKSAIKKKTINLKDKIDSKKLGKEKVVSKLVKTVKTEKDIKKVSNEQKESNRLAYWETFNKMIAEEKHTRKEIATVLLEQFPTKNYKSMLQQVSKAKNPIIWERDYKKQFKAVLTEDKNGIVKFKK